MNSLDYQRIFHEIKNTITLINSSAQLLDSKCPQLQSQPYWNNIRQEIMGMGTEIQWRTRQIPSP